MPEGLNIEIAHKLSEQEESEQRKHRWQEIAEVIEVLILAIAAIATAWSGFEASRWDGRQSLLYGQSTTQRFMASEASTRGGQQLVADSAMFTGWLQARAAGNTELEAVFVARFTPDYREAFDEWLKTNPFNNPSAPPGPAYMPTYENPELVKAEQLNSDAEVKFRTGQSGRDRQEGCAFDGVVRPCPVPRCSRSTLQTTPGPDRCECARIRLAHLHLGLRDHLASGVTPRIVR